MVVENIFDPVLNFLLPLSPFLVIFLISLLVSVITTIVYKYVTDQDKLRALKADIKRYQKKIKELKDEPKKAMKVQKDIMRLNGQYMRASFKSTLYTFLPIILFFGWLSAHYAFAPLLPVESFSIAATFQEGVSGEVSLEVPEGLILESNITQEIQSSTVMWTLSGDAGQYTDVRVIHEESGEEQYISLLITTEQLFEEPLNKITDSEVFSSIVIGNDKLYVFRTVFFFKDLPWIKDWGWFGSYFLFSIVFSTALRRLLKLA